MHPSKLPIVRNISLDDARELWRFARVRLNEERLPQVAASLTFTTVLALVPILTIAFAIFTTFPLFNSFRSALEAYFIESVMPKSIAGTILGYLNQFASQASRLSAVGASALLVTAVAMMLTIDRAFNQIWRVKTARPFWQRIVTYWAIMTLGPLLIGASLSFSSDLFAAGSWLTDRFPVMGSVASKLLSVSLTMVAFTLLYMTVPNRYVNWRDAACGGLLAALAFEFARRAFVIFITNMPAYRMIYGAVAALPLFLLWLYLSWLITLMGAVLAAALPVVKHERWRHVPTPGSAFMDAMQLLRVLYEQRMHAPVAAVDARLLRMHTRIGYEEAEALLERMLDAGWVGRVRPDVSRGPRFGRATRHGSDLWTLLANPEQLRLSDVYRLFVFSATGPGELAKQVEAAVEHGLDVSLAGHFEGARARETA